jgi:diketogulonate reductase-like aldo/keto reductase
MEFRNLGNGEALLSAIGFGTWRYTGGTEPIQAAIDHGATLIDTAESYGTEEAVGVAVRGRRKDVILATKVLPRNFRRAELTAAVERSLRRLRTDYIDLYQLHWPNYTVPIAETMSAMEALVAAGKIRFIGLSNFSVRQMQEAQACLGRIKIVSNQLRYSLIERTVEDGMLQYCRTNHITLIAFSPLGEDFSRIRSFDPNDALRAVADRLGKTRAQVALNWLISKEGVVAIPKCSSVPRAIENCEASGWKIPDDACALLSDKIRYKRRTHMESVLRRLAKHANQIFGREL